MCISCESHCSQQDRELLCRAGQEGSVHCWAMTLSPVPMFQKQENAAVPHLPWQHIGNTMILKKNVKRVMKPHTLEYLFKQ